VLLLLPCRLALCRLFAKLSMTELRARQGVCSGTCSTYHCYKVRAAAQQQLPWSCPRRLPASRVVGILYRDVPVAAASTGKHSSRCCVRCTWERAKCVLLHREPACVVMQPLQLLVCSNDSSTVLLLELVTGSKSTASNWFTFRCCPCCCCCCTTRVALLSLLRARRRWAAQCTATR
jgi:hypothetical protein